MSSYVLRQELQKILLVVILAQRCQTLSNNPMTISLFSEAFWRRGMLGYGRSRETRQERHKLPKKRCSDARLDEPTKRKRIKNEQKF